MKISQSFQVVFSASDYTGLKILSSGFSVSVAFPLFGAGAYRSKVKVAQADMVLQQKQYEYNKQLLNSRQMQMDQEVAEKQKHVGIL